MTREEVLRACPHASEATIRKTLAYHSMTGIPPLAFGSAAQPPVARSPEPDAPVKLKGLRASKRIRQDSKPLMNKLETEWFSILTTQIKRNSIIRPQAKTYRLANGLRYTPDFTALTEDENGNLCETAWEVKGKWVDGDSFPKLKMAAATWPEVVWILAWKENGQWQEQKVLP